MSAHQEFTPERGRRHRSRYWLAIGFGLAAVCVSGTALAALPATVPPETDAAPEPTIAPTTTADVPTTTTPPTTTVAPTPGPTPTPPPAPVVVDLVPLCTSSEDMDAGTRTFRLDNNGTEPVEVTLRNVATGESVSGTAAPGQSTWEVPAGDGANTTEVVANGQVVATSDSTNLMCGALHGQAECNPSNGTTTITWTVSNNDGSPAIVLSDSRDVDFQPNPDAPHGESIGIEVIDGPADDDEITETVTIQLAGDDTTELTASVTAAACTGPTLTPDVSFTFTKTPSVPTAGVGDTVEYVYCGQNNGALPLEVVRLVDDRLGVVIELPRVETVVAPGDSLCNTDIGQPVTYTVQLADIGTTITNHAVVTVRTQEATPRVFQATAAATVDVALSPSVLALLAGNEKTWVCHRTEAGAVNPYNLNNVSGSSTDASGHINHLEDIIPPGPWGPGQNYDPDNGAIWLNDCRNIEVLPVAPTLTHATCQGGVVKPPVVTVADKLGVTYTVGPDPLGDGTSNVVVTVTATLTLGYDWGSPMTAGWTASSDGRSATWTGTLNGTSCAAVAPAVPTLTQAVCTRGELQPPSLEFVPTDNVTYTADPSGGYDPGDEVIVTATLTGGAWAVNIPDEWTVVNETTATYTFTFAPASCIEAIPVEPGVIAARCTAGVLEPPRIVNRDTDGVIYTRDPHDPGDGTKDVVITVTATLSSGYAWVDPLPAGWEQAGDTTILRFELTLEAGACTPVTPAAPTVTEAVCADGVFSPPTLVVADTDQVTYVLDPGGPYSAGDTVTVTATLAAAGVGWGAELPDGWTVNSPTTATLVVVFADVACTPVSPGAPMVEQATCTAGVVVPATVTLPTTPEGITYSMDPQDLGDGTEAVTVTVTAELTDGFEWGQLVGDWTRVDATTATLIIELAAASCDEVTPAAPTVTQAVCADGVLSAPTLVFADTDDVTYSADPEGPYSAGDTVVVTATLDPAGVGWPDPLEGGWVRVDATTATLVVVFADVACTPVSPGVPVVEQATCTAGVVVPPTVTLPTTPVGITYSMDPEDLGDGTEPVTVTVTAELGDGFEWGQLGDWTRVNDTTATLTLELAAASCDEVTPAAPTVTEAVCADGVLSPPTMVSADTDGVTYSVDPEGPYSAGDTVTVTATLAAAGVGWGDQIPDGWTVDSPTTATFVVRFADVVCTPVSPGVPVVEQATCTAGAVVPSTVTLPTTPEGITYSMDPQDLGDGTEPVTVTVTAELADGFEWGQLGDWTRVNDTTATLTLELAAASCDEVTPAAPTVTEAVCADGVLSPPTMVSADTDGVTYSVDPEGPYVPGQTVVVTATLDPAGVGWGAELPDGWTVDSPTTATLVVVFAGVACTPVSPGVPVVEQATCTAGAVVPSTVTLPTTPEGITYSMDPQDLGDGTEPVTVTVTAELADGFEWGQLGDWTRVNDTTATLTLELAAASCDEVTPAAPTVTEAVCADGVLAPPTMVVADTDGVTYTVDPGPPYVSGQSVIVTAILDEAGVAWGDAVPVGWTAVDDQTATLSVTFDDVSCIAVSPADPPGPSTEGIVELPVTPGITYTVDTVDTGSPPVVRAVIPNGYRWGPLPDQWTQVDATTAVFSPASPTPTPGVLAHTGPATLALQSLLAAGLLMVGFGLLGLGRRRVVD